MTTSTLPESGNSRPQGRRSRRARLRAPANPADRATTPMTTPTRTRRHGPSPGSRRQSKKHSHRFRAGGTRAHRRLRPTPTRKTLRRNCGMRNGGPHTAIGAPGTGGGQGILVDTAASALTSMYTVTICRGPTNARGPGSRTPITLALSDSGSAQRDPLLRRTGRLGVQHLDSRIIQPIV